MTTASSVVGAQGVEALRARSRADSLYFADEFTAAAKAYRALAALQSVAADRAGLLTQAGEAELAGGDAIRARLDFVRAYTTDSATNGATADAYPLMMIGVTHRLAGSPDSALKWFSRVEQMLRDLRPDTSSLQGSAHFRENATNPSITLGLTLEGDAAILRERHRADSASHLFRRALQLLSSDQFGYREVLGDPYRKFEGRLLIYVCRSKHLPKWCESGENPIDRLELRLRQEAFVGDIAGEALTRKALLETYNAVNSVTTEFGNATSWVESIVEVPKPVGMSSSGSTGASNATLSGLLARKDELAGSLVSSDIPSQLERVHVLTEIARFYHRRLASPDLMRAAAYYDSASAMARSAVDLPLTESQRTALAERFVEIFPEWSLARLAMTRNDPFGNGVVQALGAIEEGRVRALQALRHRPDSIDNDPVESYARGEKLGDDIAEVVSSSRFGEIALLDYAIARDTLLTWVFNGHEDPVVVRSTIDSATLQKQISVLRESVLTSEDEDKRVDGAAAKFLYDLLLPTAVRKQIPDSAELIIVPDALLANIPFAVLRPDTTVEQLGLLHPLRFAPGVQLLKGNDDETLPNVFNACYREKKPEDCSPLTTPKATPAKIKAMQDAWLKESLVVGRAAAPSPIRRADNNALLQLDSLPTAAVEARDIARILGVSAVPAATATASTVKRLMKNAPIIHLATHGIAYSDTRVSRRSFLIFAGDHGGDSYLEAGQLLDDSSLKLRADLVVLSACETALGEGTRAEGTIGLQRAFLARGAHSMLVSQWEANDEATGLIMTEFYRKWLDPSAGRTKAAAFRDAVRAVITQNERFSNPYYWAAFQVVGAP